MTKTNRSDIYTTFAICAFAWLANYNAHDFVDTILYEFAPAFIVDHSAEIPWIRLVFKILLGVLCLVTASKMSLPAKVTFFLLLLSAYCLIPSALTLIRAGVLDNEHSISVIIPRLPPVSYIVRIAVLIVGITSYITLIVLLAKQFGKFAPPLLVLIVPAFLTQALLFPCPLFAFPESLKKYLLVVFTLPLAYTALLAIPLLNRKRDGDESLVTIERTPALIVAGLICVAVYVFQLPLGSWLSKSEGNLQQFFSPTICGLPNLIEIVISCSCCP